MRSPFPQKPPTRKKSSDSFPILQILILGLVITIFAAVIVQNLQPLVQIFFLGQKTLPIPLSVAMVVAFAVGGLTALVINAIASYQQNIAIRRAVATGAKEEAKKEVEPNNFSSNYQPPKSPNPSSSPTKEQTPTPVAQEEYEDEYEDDWEEENDDWEEEEEYEDDDPDTVPYGDRKNLKSANPQREKRDRPPLEAKYIR